LKVEVFAWLTKSVTAPSVGAIRQEVDMPEAATGMAVHSWFV
jgi:hypothetical protein